MEGTAAKRGGHNLNLPFGQRTAFVSVRLKLILPQTQVSFWSGCRNIRSYPELALFAVHEAARHLVASRLKSFHGNASQTFAVLDRALQKLHALSGKLKHSISGCLALNFTCLCRHSLHKQGRSCCGSFFQCNCRHSVPKVC